LRQLRNLYICNHFRNACRAHNTLQHLIITCCCWVFLHNVWPRVLAPVELSISFFACVEARRRSSRFQREFRPVAHACTSHKQQEHASKSHPKPSPTASAGAGRVRPTDTHAYTGAQGSTRRLDMLHSFAIRRHNTATHLHQTSSCSSHQSLSVACPSSGVLRHCSVCLQAPTTK